MAFSVLSVAGVRAKLAKCKGNMAMVGRHFGVTRAAVRQYILKHPELVEAAHDIREGMKDFAESALFKALERGAAWAICFYLKTQAKDRGYIERSEIQQERVKKRIVEEIVSGDAGSRDAPGAEGVPG